MRRLTVLLVFVAAASARGQTMRDSLSRPPVADRVILRAFTGYAAGIPLMLLGGRIGYYYERTHYHCGCDDPGLEGMIVGASMGLVVGSTLGSALPRLDSSCPVGHRIGRALLASTATVAASYVIARVRQSPQMLLISFAAPVSAAVAQGRC